MIILMRHEKIYHIKMLIFNISFIKVSQFGKLRLTKPTKLRKKQSSKKEKKQRKNTAKKDIEIENLTIIKLNDS